MTVKRWLLIIGSAATVMAATGTICSIKPAIHASVWQYLVGFVIVAVGIGIAGRRSDIAKSQGVKSGAIESLPFFFSMQAGPWCVRHSILEACFLWGLTWVLMIPMIRYMRKLETKTYTPEDIEELSGGIAKF